MDKYGTEVNLKIQRDIDFENYLRVIFLIEQDELLLTAAMDDTRRRNLSFVLGFSDHWNNRGAQVNYCKKTCRFDFIQYSVKGYAKRFAI